MPKMKTLTINGTTFDIVDNNAVHYTEQALTSEQKAQIIENIGAVPNTITIEGYETRSSYNKTDVLGNATRYPGQFIYYAWDSSISKMGLLTYENTSWDYYSLPVTPGEIYGIETIIAAMPFACAFVDSTGKCLERIPEELPSNVTAYSGQVIVPANAVTMYVNASANGYLNAIEISKLDSIEANFNFYRTEPSNSDIDHLYGKKLAYVGDSITEAANPNGGYFNDYAAIVAARHGMKVYKDGVAGSTMANVSGQYPFCVDRYLDIPSDFDILTIWFGWNDASAASVGTISDTVDTTFYGAYNKVLTHLITTYPTKKIGLIVPYGGEAQAAVQEAVRELSKKYGCPCLDLADSKQCSLIYGWENEAQTARTNALLYDTVHLNQDGHNFLSTMYEEFIKRL